MAVANEPLNPVTPIYNGAVLSSSNPLLVSGSLTPYPIGGTVITGNSTGSTGAVVGTLAAAVGKTTYISGMIVSAIGGVATIGPITVAGLVTSSMVYYLASTATGVSLAVQFNPPIPASTTNTAITITTTANGTATAVTVNSWGFQL